MESQKKDRLWCLYYRPEDRLLRGLTLLEARAVATSLSHMEKIHWLAWKEKWDIWRTLPEIEELMEPLSRTISGRMPKVSELQDIDDLEPSDVRTLATELTSREPETATSLKGLNAKSSLKSSRDRRADADHPKGAGPRDRRRSSSGAQEERRVESYNPSTVENLGDITLVDESLFEDFDLEVLESSKVTGKELRDFKARSFKRHRVRLKVIVTGSRGQRYETFSEDASVGGVRLVQSLPGWALGNIQVKLIDESRKQAVEITCQVINGQSSDNRRRLTVLPLKRKSEEVQFDKWLEAS